VVAELNHRPVALIVGDSNSSTRPRPQLRVPVVFASGADPVRDGLVARLNRTSGNLTGASFFGGMLGAKRRDLLRQLAPRDDYCHARELEQ